MANMFCLYLTPREWAVLKDVIDTAIESYVELDMRPEELATIQLKESVKDSYEIVNI